MKIESRKLAIRPSWAVMLLPLLFVSCSRAETLDVSRLQVPAGFHITVFAQAPHARMMAFSPGGALLVSDKADGKILAFLDPQRTGNAQKSGTVLEGLNSPHGIAFYQGRLYVAETNAVRRYDWDDAQLRASGGQQIASLPGGGMHDTRTILFGNGKMYVSVGSDCNVCVERDKRRAAVLEFNIDGSGERVFASGLRNAVGMALNPPTGTVWVTENGRDQLGDDIPPDEVNDLGRNGGNFGWPYCYGNRVPDTSQSKSYDCTSTVPAKVEIQAHSAPLGLAFYTDTMFPAEYRGSLYVALHGSWNRRVPTGYKVIRIKMDADGQPIGAPEDFITGWLEPKDRKGARMGRPVGIVVGPDDAMYISDDTAGVIYRVTWRK